MSSRRYFEDVAPQWDAMRSEFYSVRVRERAHAAARLAAGLTVVDVGAGSGFLCEGLAGRGLRVIAVDPAAAMLAELRRRLPELHVDCREGDAGRLPVGDGEAEVVFGNMMLHHVAHPAAAIAEMVRVLRPGGRVVLTDLDAHEHAFLRREHHDRWLGFERAEVRRWLEGAGLWNVRVEDAGED